MRDLGSLGNCLVEGQEGAGLRSPRRRRIALLLSILLQVTVLTALVLAPLLVRGERLQTTWIQVPGPIVGHRPVPTQRDQRPTNRRPPDRRPTSGGLIQFVEPPRIPERIGNPNDADTAASVPDVGSGGSEIWGAIPNLNPNGPRWHPPVPEPPRPNPAEPPRRLRISEMNLAKLVHRVEPVYPPLAIQTRTQGTVVLRALIGTDGAVREVQLLSGHIVLAQAAMDAVVQWRYQPTLLNGQPVEVETRVTVIFTLNR